MHLDFNKDVVIPALLIMTVYVGWAQGTMDWSKNNPIVKEKQALYSDAMKNEDYKMAEDPLNWLLDSVPTLSKSLYINGDKLYKELERQEKNEETKRFYQEKRLSLFDQRLLYFADSINVVNRKAYAAYTYYKNRPEKYNELYTLFEKVLALNATDILKANIAAYPYVLELYKAKGGIVADDIILSRYDKITGIIQKRNLSEAIQRSADDMMSNGLALDCDIINSRFGVPFLKNKDDISKARRVVRLGLIHKCKSLPVFLEAAKKVHEAKPEENIAYMIAKAYHKKNNFNEAEIYYREALKLTDDNDRKAEIYYSLATIFQQDNSKEKARTAALNSLVYNPFSKKPYRLIGDLYLSSYEDCKQEKSRTQDRAIYIAAFDMYKKAGDKVMMQEAKLQFPSGEDIFTDALEIGQTADIGCWVNEQVILQKR